MSEEKQKDKEMSEKKNQKERKKKKPIKIKRGHFACLMKKNKVESLILL